MLLKRALVVFFFFFSSSFAFVLSRILCDSFKLTHSLCLNETDVARACARTGEEDIQRVLSAGECPICQKAVLERHVEQTPLVLDEETVQVCVFVVSLLHTIKNKYRLH